MAADYDEVVEGTVDEVREAVEEQDLDPEKVLEAEEANKDRVTLTRWLEDRIEESEETGEEAAGEGDEDDAREAAEQLSMDETPGKGISGVLTSREFVAGLTVGLVIAALALAMWGGASGGMSAAEAGQAVETYFAENADGVPLNNVTVQEVKPLPGGELYSLSMVLSAQFMNNTVTQNLTGVITTSGRYMFLTSPIDTSKPLGPQIQRAQGGQAQ